MTELLQRLSEAVPELCGVLNTDSGTPAYRIICEDYHFCLYPTCTELLPWQKNDRTCAIARIRDWIVAQYGQVIVYDTLVLTRKFSWKVYDIVAEQFVYESDAHEDELEVAIECALALVKEKTE